MIKRSVFQSICRGLLIAGFCTQAAEADLSDNLIAYYPFDDGNGEVIDEQTGKSNDAELFNFDFEGDSRRAFLRWHRRLRDRFRYAARRNRLVGFNLGLRQRRTSVGVAR